MKIEITRKILALVLILTWVFSPVVPVINLPEPESGEKISLGLEVNKAEAQYSSGYSYRRTITIQESQVTGGGNLTNFPVLMSFTEPELRTTGNGGNVTDAQGDDIIFASDVDGNTVLDFERERYTPTTGEITAWVEIPTLDFDDNTVVYMFYGNSSVTSSQEDVSGTWDSNYVGVWHMDDSGATNSDSAGTANDGSVSGATAGAIGKIGPAYSFDGTNDVSTVTDHADLDITNTGTIEAWMQTDNINGSQSNFSTWVSRDTPGVPTGGGADDQSGIDSTIVGEAVHYGAFLCNEATGDFGFATTSLSGATFNNWNMTTFTPPGGCGSQEGGVLGMDSDGVYIYYSALGVSGTTETFTTATATPTYSSVSAWRNDADPQGGGTAEANGVDMVIVDDTAYYNAVVVTGTTEQVSTTSRAINTFGAMTWRTSTVNNFGAAANENCSISVDSEGDRLYRTILCSDGVDPEENYNMSSTTVTSTTPLTWRVQTAPTGAGTAGFNDMDIVAMGGLIHHAAFLHNGVTEAVSTASSSMANGGTLSWTSRIDGSSNPNGTSATQSVSIAVASDGKNLYYGALASTTAGAFFTASSSLPAHPFVSKRNAYEAIQVGTGYAFDWAGRPYTFGTSTNTTNFRHVVVTQDGTDLRMYENGVLRRWQRTSVDFESNANNLLIGGGNRSDGTAIYFDGIIDEVRISNDDRSADWILTGYNNQNSTSTFYTISAEEEAAALPTVTTSFATPGFNTATLHGVMTSAGSADQHGFAHSTDSALSTGVSTSTLGTLDGNHAFSNQITGLSPGVTYFYRAYATNGSLTGVGEIKSFTTGNSTAVRNMRLFGKLRVISGKAILYQMGSSAGGGGGGSAPTVTTDANATTKGTWLGADWMYVGGNITSIGGDAPTVRGFAFGNNCPGLQDICTSTTTENGTFGTGAFPSPVDCTMSNDTSEDIYYRAYATNSFGTGYGTIESDTPGGANSDCAGGG